MLETWNAIQDPTIRECVDRNILRNLSSAPMYDLDLVFIKVYWTIAQSSSM